jgi:protein Tex
MTTIQTPYAQIVASKLNIRATQVAAAIALLDDDNTIPFIARYRKEMTGSLDEDQLRQIAELLEKLRTLDKRREAILGSIREQGKLTPELEARIAAVETLNELEDLYQPYKPKRRTRASIAREKGLQPLADLILQQPRLNQSLEALAAPFLNDEVKTIEEAFAGAQDIIAEAISDHPDVRGQVRQKALKWGLAKSQRTKDAEDPKGVYELYYDFEYRIDRLQPHQILAINRGEAEKVLRVAIDVAERDWREPVESVFRPDRRSPLAGMLQAAIADAAVRLLLPAIERDVRRELTEKAEQHAISVFASNLRGLLNQPPLAGHVILGIDPGFRTGSKVAVIDATGKVLETATIYPHEPQREWEKSRKILAALVQKHQVTLIAIGNGTASRETEKLAAELTRGMDGIHYIMVNEAGASVYSASPEARAELPDLDVTLRGAVSIARRVQDPLAELVKIDPKSIGVGMYQHDVDQSELSGALNGVVESVVNNVGVDVNTASPALLTYVAGIGPKLAERIVEYRNSNGKFANRKTLQKVSGLGPKAFEQAAGFLRVRDGDNPLDSSAIHPESYKIAEAVLKRAGLTAKTPLPEREIALAPLKSQLPKLAAELGAGEPTLQDILDQLVRPGRDPREDLPAPILRSDVLSMADLKPGMLLNGTARNVVDFGVFIDIGVKQDGLLHKSQIPRGTKINVGDVLEVTILSVKAERGRISLSLPQ